MQTIMFIITWEILMVEQIFLSSQVQRRVIISIKLTFDMKTKVCLKYFVNDSRRQILALTDNFDFLNQICPKKQFSVLNKIEHYHWIVLNQISLQSVTKCLRLTLIFVWNSALREKFNCYFSGLVLLLFTKFSFLKGELTLGYHLTKFGHFPNIS